MSLLGLCHAIFLALEDGIIAYVAVINLIYLGLLLLGYFVLRKRSTELEREELEVLAKSPLVAPVTILAPAYNEAATIRDSVRAMLALNHPNHELIVINDGSRDDTLQILIDEFHLYRSSRTPTAELPSQPIRAIYESREPIALVVIDKQNGGKADSLNAGLNVVRAPLVAVVDSDSVLESNALLYAQRPFLDDPSVLASGGIIRVINGCEVSDGRITRISVGNSLLAALQVIEYFRAFLGARVAFSFFNCLLIVSGAFGLFRRDAVVEAGGFDRNTVGEDMELVVRLHRRSHEAGRPYRIVFVPEPVCWTQVPERLRVLRTQRNRWQRGTVETLRKHRRLFGNPRYGLLGMFAIPYYAAFEMFGPLIEFTGYVVTLGGLAIGWIPPAIAIVFFLVAIGLGLVLSLSGIVLAELTTRRYPQARDILRLFAVSVVENLGLRLLITFWRVQGLIDGLRGKQGWGTMERRRFRTAKAAPP